MASSSGSQSGPENKTPEIAKEVNKEDPKDVETMVIDVHLVDVPLLPKRRTTSLCYRVLFGDGSDAPSENQLKGVYGTISTIIVVLYIGYSTGVIGSLDIASWAGIPLTPVLLGLVGAGTLFAFVGFLHVFVPRSTWSMLSFIFCTMVVICISVALICLYWTGASHYGLLGRCLVWTVGALVMMICVGIFVGLLCEKDHMALTYLMGTE